MENLKGPRIDLLAHTIKDTQDTTEDIDEQSIIQNSRKTRKQDLTGQNKTKTYRHSNTEAQNNMHSNTKIQNGTKKQENSSNSKEKYVQGNKKTQNGIQSNNKTQNDIKTYGIATHNDRNFQNHRILNETQNITKSDATATNSDRNTQNYNNFKQLRSRNINIPSPPCSIDHDTTHNVNDHQVKDSKNNDTKGSIYDEIDKNAERELSNPPSTSQRGRQRKRNTRYNTNEWTT